MASIKDDRGFNQGFKPTKALAVRTQRRCDFIGSRIAPKEGLEILEIGCGTGELSYLLAKTTGQKVLGTDLCVTFIEQARTNYSDINLEYQVLDFHDPDSNVHLRHKKFDYIVGNGILHHLHDQLDRSLASMNLLLKKDGRIIFLEPNIMNPYCLLIFKTSLGRKFANLEPAEMAFTKADILQKLGSNKFCEASVEYRDFLLPITPGPLIKPLILLGDRLEKVPLLKKLSQSIYIEARKI